MRIRSLGASEWALVPQELRAVLARAGARAGRPDDKDDTPWLEICDADQNVLAAVRLRDPACLQTVQQQAAALDYRSLRLAALGASGPSRALLIRNRLPAQARQDASPARLLKPGEQVESLGAEAMVDAHAKFGN